MASEFLELIDSIRSEQKDYSTQLDKMFNESEKSVRSITEKKKKSERYTEQFIEAIKVYENAFVSRHGTFIFQEALTTSDFPLLFGDIIDRQMLGYYQEAPYTWSNWARRGTVPDFRTVKRFAIDGSEAVLDSIAQQEQYHESKLSDTRYSYTVGKYGRRLPFAWETMINDDLDALKDAPARFGRAARRSEEKFATGLIAISTGPDSTLYSDTHKNKVNSTGGATATNPPLSISGFQDAITVLLSQTDTEGEPITIEGIELVVPPQLKVTAMNILNATQLLVGAFGQSPLSGDRSGGSQMQNMLVNNWLQNNIRLSVNAYLPIIDTTHGKTAYYLFASPSVGRPAVEVGFLRGHEAPEIFIREPNARRVGAGASDPMNGSFDSDTIDYKIRHVFGGTTMDFRTTCASNGSGS